MHGTTTWRTTTKGWLSGKRFKAVFWPECETVAQRLAWMKRMGLLGLSAGLTIGVIVTIVLTAGLSSPWSQCAVKGGFDSLRETISKEAVLDGRDVQKHLISTGAGYLLAFLPGGAAIGASLVQSTALSASEFLGIRIAIAMHWMCNCKISGHRCEEFHGRWQDHC